MAISWGRVFDNYGVKVVTKTDKRKAAYVPNSAQVAAITAAGILPSKTRPAGTLNITVLSDDKIKSVIASFYHAVRVPDPGRKPEPRMGHAFISSWLQEGDCIVIGNIGTELFAGKLATSPVSEDAIHLEITKKAAKTTVIDRAKKATGKPLKRIVTREDYQRDPYVVMAAIHRSGGKCEMPQCKNALFIREEGTPYLEVHHITPLAEGGEDTYENVAALCPHCHREVHYGKLKKIRRKVLRKRIAALV